MTATVLQLSDIHLTAQRGGPVLGVDPDARLAKVLTAWAGLEEAADLVVLSGDNTDDGTVEAYGRLVDVVSTLGAPVLAVPGNHDVPSRVSAAFGGATSAEVGSWRVVGLDTSLPGEIHGSVDAKEVSGSTASISAPRWWCCIIPRCRAARIPGSGSMVATSY